MPTATATLTQGDSAPTTPASGVPTATPSGWFDSVKDTEVKTWLGTKNFPDAETAFKSHRNLESLMGADKAGRTLLMPKDDSDAEGWKQLNSRLGVPETADGYKLPTPEGADDGFSRTASQWFHEAGLRPAAANKIAERWNTWVQEQVTSGEAADRAESERQMSALQAEWGNDFTAKQELARRGYREFAAKFGLSETASLERAESILGAANLTKFFAGLGALNSESSFAGADGKGGFNPSAKDAQNRIREIQQQRLEGKINDHQWRTTYEPEIMKLRDAVVAGMPR